jgi:hypothetical protein
MIIQDANGNWVYQKSRVADELEAALTDMRRHNVNITRICLNQITWYRWMDDYNLPIMRGTSGWVGEFQGIPVYVEVGLTHNNERWDFVIYSQITRAVRINWASHA